MKSIKTIFASVILIALVSVSAFAGTGAKVIAVVNQAGWCPVCQNNGMRAMDAFKANNQDMAIQFVANDLTNDETKAKSAEELKKLGLISKDNHSWKKNSTAKKIIVLPA